MSAGPANALRDTQVGSPHIAASAVIVGTARLGEGSLLAEGAVIRSDTAAVQIGTGSAVLENSVVVGTRTIPTKIGRRTTFGHRCIAIGATVGDLCEIGNASKLMPGARLGDRVFLGEGTLVPAGMTLPSDVVAVGRPARIIRTASADDLARLLALRDGDLSIPPPTAITVEDTQETITMGQLYEYRGIIPTIAASAALFLTAEITGDVVVGDRTIIDAGVKIIGVASTGSTAPAYRVDLRAGTHQLVADEPAATGGGGLGPSPFELLLSALAACTATTLRMYADRHGWALPSVDVGVRYNLDDDGRGAIERMITVPVDLTAEQRHRLADIAERTPVTLAVRAGTPITTRLRENQTTRASI